VGRGGDREAGGQVEVERLHVQKFHIIMLLREKNYCYYYIRLLLPKHTFLLPHLSLSLSTLF
jgi:hypothetical protein